MYTNLNEEQPNEYHVLFRADEFGDECAIVYDHGNRYMCRIYPRNVETTDEFKARSIDICRRLEATDDDPDCGMFLGG